MAIKLKQAGIDDFVILEKSPELGGTWHDNTYPGAECDVASAMYSYSFAPNLEWSRKWSDQAQIKAYQKMVAQRYGIIPHIRFGVTVQTAHYSDADKLWTLTSVDNDTFSAQHFICAVGQLHEVSMPNLQGRFSGQSFHSARWDHGVSLHDKKVGVIGNAASAVQLVPEVAAIAAELTVFQRSPNWQFKKNNRAFTQIEKKLFRLLPWLMKLYRLQVWILGEYVIFPAIKRNGLMRKVVKFMVVKNLKDNIADPKLRQQLTPDYTIGAKRILFSHTYYQALNRPNVRLQTQPITRLTSDGVVCDDGTQHQFDVIIYATGFTTNPFIKSIEVLGADGVRLHDVWQEGATAYLGLHTAGFPNLHMLYGPNTNLGHNSIILMLEAQVRYVVEAITHLDNIAKLSMAVKQASEQAYNQQLQAALAKMSFYEIDKSWYMDGNKVTNNWSGSVGAYRAKLKQINWDCYNLT